MDNAIKASPRPKAWLKVLGWIFLVLGVYILPVGIQTLMSLLGELQRIKLHGTSMTSGTNVGMGVGISFPILFISLSLIVAGLFFVLRGKTNKYRIWFILAVIFSSSLYSIITIIKIQNYGHEQSIAYDAYARLDEGSLIKSFQKEAGGNDRNKIFALMQVLVEKKSLQSASIFEEIIEKRKLDQIWGQAVYWLPKLDKERALAVLHRLASDAGDPEKQRVTAQEYNKLLANQPPPQSP